MRGPGPRAGHEGPLPFRPFVNVQMYRLVLGNAILSSIMLVVSLLKSAWIHGSLLTELYTNPIFGTAYMLLPIALLLSPQHMEACCAVAMLSRGLQTVLVSAGVLPLPPYAGFMVGLHMEKIHELYVPLAEPVRTSIALPIRIMICIGYAGMYAKLGVPHPWLQSMCLNLLGLLVGVLANLRFHRLYKLYLGRHQQQLLQQQQQQEQLQKSGTSAKGPGQVVDEPHEQQAGSITAAAAAASCSHTAAVGTAHDTREAMPAMASSNAQHAQHTQHAQQAVSPLPGPAVTQGAVQRHCGRRKHTTYKSKMAQPTSRVAVTLHGGLSLANLSPREVSALKEVLQQRVPGACKDSLCIRSGCVSLCLDIRAVVPPPSQQQQQGLNLQALCEYASGAVVQWSRELGLEKQEDFILVQACHGNQHAQLVLPGSDSSQSIHVSMSDVTNGLLLRDPVLLLPPCLTENTPGGPGGCPAGQQQGENEQQGGADHTEVPESHAQHQGQQQLGQQQPFSFSQPLEVNVLCDVSAPPEVEPGPVRGWHCTSDSPEERGGKDRTLMASTYGTFCPVCVKPVVSSGNTQTVEACISLPPEAVRLAPSCPFKLDLWAGGNLSCSAAAILLPHQHAPAVSELNDWVQATPALTSLAFLGDLVEWMHYQNSSTRAHREAEGAEGMTEAMAGVGQELLVFSFGQGLEELAGLIFEGLLGPPFSLSFDALAQDLMNAMNGSEDSPDVHPTRDEASCMDHESKSTASLSPPGVAAHWQASVAQFLAKLKAHSLGSNRSNSSSDKAPPASTCASTPESPATPSRVASHTTTASSLSRWLYRSCLYSLPVLTGGWCNRSSGPVGTTSSISNDSKARKQRQEYRVWASLQSANILKFHLLSANTHFLILLLRSVVAGHAMADAPLISSLLIVYVPAFVAVMRRPDKAEVIPVFTHLGRVASIGALGVGAVRFPSSFDPVRKFRVELVAEVFLAGCFERTRVSWILPLRLLLVISYALYNQACSFNYPWLQSLAMNCCGLLVSCLVCYRYKSTYTQQQSESPGSKKKTL